MENSSARTKVILLTSSQANLAYVILKSEGLLQGKRSIAHKDLESKLEQAKQITSRGLSIAMQFNEQERQLMRECNMNYCDRLATNMQTVKEGFRHLHHVYALETYELATQIQLQFSSQFMR